MGPSLFLKRQLLILLPAFCCAMPSGMDLIEGEVSTRVQENCLEISAGEKAVLHWEDFSLKPSEILHFIQPTKESIAINRVIGKEISNIQGRIDAKGEIVLINPNGILFSKDSFVNVGALLATTFSVNEGQFFGDSVEGIQHLGEIQARRVTFVAKTIENLGKIVADEVVLAAGVDIALDFAANQRIHIDKIEGASLYECAINTKGMIEDVEAVLRMEEEASIEAPGGRVLLWAEDHAEFQGKIDASKGKSPGFVEVSSPKSFLALGSVKTASVEGVAGTLLFDPSDVTISVAPDTGGVTPTPPPPPPPTGGPYNYDFMAVTPVNINTTTLVTFLNDNDVTIDVSNSTALGTGTLTVSDPVTWSPPAADTKLTLIANEPGSILQIDDLITCTKTTIPAATTILDIQGTTINIGDSGQTHTVNTGMLATSGSISITAGDLNLFGGIGAVDADAIIHTDNGGNISINTTGDITLIAGPSGSASHDAEIVTLDSGDITVMAGGNVSLTNGVSGLMTARADIQSARGGSGNVTLQCNDLNLTAVGPSLVMFDYVGIFGGSTFPATAGTGNVDLTVLGNLTMTGALSGADEQPQITSNGTALFPQDLNIRVGGNVLMTAGVGSTSALTQIFTRFGSLNLDIDGTLTMRNGPGPFSGTRILTLETGSPGDNSLTVTARGGVTLDSSFGTGASAVTSIFSFASPDLVTVNGGGALTLIGGGASGNTSTIENLGGGPISIGGFSSMTLQGGTSLVGDSFARVQTPTGGTIAIDIDGPLTLNAGTGLNSTAEILSAGTSGTGGISIAAGDIFLNGGSITPANVATIEAGSGTGVHPISLSSFSRLECMGGSSLGSFTRISTFGDPGSDITISGGSCTFQAGAGNGSFSSITASSGNISIDASGNVSLTSSASPGLSVINITTIGAIDIDCADLSVTANTALAAVTTGSGDITIDCNNCTVQDGDIATFGSDLTITALDDINWLGTANFSTPAPTGNLTAIAGNNFLIEAGVTVSVLGSGELNLVCDNDFPAPPFFGNGSFTIAPGATITTIGNDPARIFTVTRALNSIPGPINGNALIAGPEFVNSPQEQWGFYFPQSFFGDQGFTIFYKILPSLNSAVTVAVEMQLIDLNGFGFPGDFYYTNFSINQNPYSMLRKIHGEKVGRTVAPAIIPLYPFTAK